MAVAIKWVEPFTDQISSEMWKVMNWPIVYPVHGGLIDRKIHTCTNGAYRGVKIAKEHFFRATLQECCFLVKVSG